MIFRYVLTTFLIGLLFSFQTGVQAQGLYPIPQIEVRSLIDVMDSLLVEWEDHIRYPTRQDTQELNIYQFAPDEVPTYAPSVYRQRLDDLCTIFDMDYNDRVQDFIELYTVRKRDLTSRLLGLQHVYFPMIEEIFIHEGLPLELKYLAVIESALNPRAVSPARATGLWQFMYGTGKEYGLEINNFVDQRRDPYRATLAAARYLKALYSLYNDWQLVIAAYNCGPGRVNRAIRYAKGSTDFWEVSRYLPRETSSYVPAFIAANYAMVYHREHNLYPIWTEFSYDQDTMAVVDREISLERLARITDCELETLRDLNPELTRDLIPRTPEGYVLRVPREVGRLVTERPTLLDTILPGDEAPVKEHLVYHTVKPGETLTGIAKTYEVPLASLIAWNPKTHRRMLRAGESLVVKIETRRNDDEWIVRNLEDQANKQKDTPPAKLVSMKSEDPESSGKNIPKHYRVRRGDTLWNIAQRFSHAGITVAKLREINGIRNSRSLQAGELLQLRPD